MKRRREILHDKVLRKVAAINEPTEMLHKKMLIYGFKESCILIGCHPVRKNPRIRTAVRKFPYSDQLLVE